MEVFSCICTFLEHSPLPFHYHQDEEASEMLRSQNMAGPHSVSGQPGSLEPKPGLGLRCTGLCGWIIAFTKLVSDLHLAIFFNLWDPGQCTLSLLMFLSMNIDYIHPRKAQNETMKVKIQTLAL